MVSRSDVLGDGAVLREFDDRACLSEMGGGVLLRNEGDGGSLPLRGGGACLTERRERDDGGVELVYFWPRIYQRRLHGGVEQLLGLLAVAGDALGV